MHFWINWIEGRGAWSPLIFVGVFLAASLLTIWRLESMSAGGLDGTVIGTLVTPYMTGMGNLIFAFVMARTTLEGERQRRSRAPNLTACHTGYS